jgi:hypothetical protein
MKKLHLFILALLAFTWSPPAKAELNVSLFYDSLEPYGEWIDAGDYGYVWHPADVDESWRPYTVGHWVFTDAGWTWLSDEPFGWATYHYGRWANLVSTGWVWVPDTEWGPAWVSWRRSPRHVGWAPLPPEARFRREIPISSWADSYYDIGPSFYSFVEVRQFGAPRMREVVLPPRENVTIINETRNITNISYRNNVVYNGGPEYDVIVRESAQPIRRLRLERRTEVDAGGGALRAEALRPQVQGDALRMLAPPLEATGQAAPRRVARKVEKAEVDRGWRDVADKGQAEQLRARMRAEAKPPAELPPQPKFERVIAKESERSGKAAAKADATAGVIPSATTVPGTPTAPSDKPAAIVEKPLRTADQPTAAPPGSTVDRGVQAGRKARAKKGADITSDPGAAPTAEATVADEPAKPNRKGRKEVKAAAAATSEKSDATSAADRELPAAARPGKAGKKGVKVIEPATAPDVDTSATLPAERPDSAGESLDRPGRKRAKGDAVDAAAAGVTTPSAPLPDEVPKDKADKVRGKKAREAAGDGAKRGADVSADANGAQPRQGAKASAGAKGKGAEGERKKLKKENEEQQ